MPIAAGQWSRHRLSGRKTFARVFGGRHSAGNARLVVYAMRNELNVTRMGLSVGRKCGNAVTRNQLKRWLREAFRASYDHLPEGYDLICIPRPEAIQSLDDCKAALVTVATQAVARCRAGSRTVSRSRRGRNA